MTKGRPQVVFSLFGDQKDGRHHKDHDAGRIFRYTLELCKGWPRDKPALHKLVLLHQERHAGRALELEQTILAALPGLTVERRTIDLGSKPWDLPSVHEALSKLAREYPFDLAHEDYWFHLSTGTEVFKACLFLLAVSRVLPVNLVQTIPEKAGQLQAEAEPAGVKPIDLDVSAYDPIRKRIENDRVRRLDELAGGAPVRSEKQKALLAQILEVAERTDDTIVLLGAPGTGKTFIARAIHEQLEQRAVHPRKGRLFEVNCAALRGELVRSEIFGHEKGAFSGALARRTGAILSADGGTLFLDEVADLDPEAQGMLLKVLEDKRCRPLGADVEKPVDFFLICATNKDIASLVVEGEFRRDLWERLDVHVFELHPLRMHPEEIEGLVLAEIERRGKKRPIRFAGKPLDRFLRWAKKAPWPGNIRELLASVGRMVDLSVDGIITEAVAEAEIEKRREAWRRKQAPRREIGARLLDELLPRAELDRIPLAKRRELEAVVESCASSKYGSDAAKEVLAECKNPSDSISKFLRRYGLTVKAIQEAAKRR
ncbi:MAG TPA: RNA repair transcriptional activator RtcR family protein [Myxococcota bacterium]|nr:RNA repair transcriptional activator RtcR family protein [Myxococcota bacterium]HRY96622.1 RNA repair transcriptional activator RtcR family protein [Myxococcota bacterium]HSA21417.1 RNA repair transcriptional activator RtcR family protein [Myxococcota bacterium]